MPNSDRIFLTGLEIETIIGIYDWERSTKQRVSIDVEMPADARRAADHDDIEHTLNYKKVAKRIIAFVGESRFQLVETLAERVAGIVLNEFALDWVEVRINKPGAIRGAQDVGVKVRRGLPEQGGPMRAYVSLGSNIEPERNLRLALDALREGFGPLSVSTVYRNKAVGFEGDDFLNLVAGFDTDKSPAELLAELRDIEARYGRERGVDKFSPRSLDLDLLLYGNAVIDDGKVQVPRKELERYPFMLRPLAELAGNLRHPVSGRSLYDIWAEQDPAAHPMTPVTI